MSSVVASYVYRDSLGKPLARIDRVEPGWRGRGKEFLPYATDESGTFYAHAGLNGVKLPLYRLDELGTAIDASATVYVTEGEGKSDRLRAIIRREGNASAVTTIQGGANATIRDEHVESLKGAHRVVVLADSDEPGRRAACLRAQRIAEANPVCEVRVLDLYPHRDDGSDVADWLDDGHTLGELRAIADAAVRVEMPPRPDASPHDWVRIGALLAESDEPTRWLVENLLLDAGTSLLVAKPKVGKSTLVRDLAFCVARGALFLGKEVTAGTVLYVALEDKRAELRRTFRAMGASADDSIEFYIGGAPAGALEWLQQKAEQRKPKLIVVDTFQRFARLQDLNDYAQVTNALDPLTHLARDCGAHLMLTHHGRKSGGSGGDAVLGSTALFGAVDTLLEMRNRNGVRSLSSIQRYGVDMEPTIIGFEATLCRVNANGSAADAERSRIESEILTCVESADEPLIGEDLFQRIEGRHCVKLAARKSLVERGLIERSGEGKKGDPFLYAPLPRSDSDIPVPTNPRELENRNPKSCENADGITPDFDSRRKEDSARAT